MCHGAVSERGRPGRGASNSSAGPTASRGSGAFLRRTCVSAVNRRAGERLEREQRCRRHLAEYRSSPAGRRRRPVVVSQPTFARRRHLAGVGWRELIQAASCGPPASLSPSSFSFRPSSVDPSHANWSQTLPSTPMPGERSASRPTAATGSAIFTSSHLRRVPPRAPRPAANMGRSLVQA